MHKSSSSMRVAFAVLVCNLTALPRLSVAESPRLGPEVQQRQLSCQPRSDMAAQVEPLQ